MKDKMLEIDPKDRADSYGRLVGFSLFREDVCIILFSKIDCRNIGGECSCALCYGGTKESCSNKEGH